MVTFFLPVNNGESSKRKVLEALGHNKPDDIRQVHGLAFCKGRLMPLYRLRTAALLPHMKQGIENAGGTDFSTRVFHLVFASSAARVSGQACA